MPSRRSPAEQHASDDPEEVGLPADGAPSLWAYTLPGRPSIDIVPASRWREWMDQTDYRWPNRCLPLLMANESGWCLINPAGFAAIWDGGPGHGSLSLEFDDDLPSYKAVATSQFGLGIVTWNVPYLFRSDPGWDLLVRGPANYPKDGVAPLEGLVETDWATATFTMNWKLTRAGSVRFEAGEPFCMVVPQRRRELERFDPIRAELRDNAELHEACDAWGAARRELAIRKFVGQFGEVEGGTDPSEWQQHYFKGKTVSGPDAPDHETKRRLRAFRRAGE
jgi:hypothetical protein